MTRRSWPAVSRAGKLTLAAVTGIAGSVALTTVSASAADDQSAQAARLRGSVGPGYSISISDDSVPAGRYKLIVTDRSTIHNFHITGPGVDKKTRVRATGKVVWTLKLRAGTYKIVCDPHDDVMKTTLTVT